MKEVSLVDKRKMINGAPTDTVRSLRGRSAHWLEEEDDDDDDDNVIL